MVDITTPEMEFCLKCGTNFKRKPGRIYASCQCPDEGLINTPVKMTYSRIWEWENVRITYIREGDPNTIAPGANTRKGASIMQIYHTTKRRLARPEDLPERARQIIVNRFCRETGRDVILYLDEVLEAQAEQYERLNKHRLDTARKAPGKSQRSLAVKAAGQESRPRPRLRPRARV